MRQVAVDLGERSYKVLIGAGLLKQSGQLLTGVLKADRILVVSNPIVYPLYGDQVVNSLRHAGFDITVGIMPDGEKYKNIDEAMKILDIAVAAGLERNSAVIALGGGVTGDLAGLVAALYMRGINFVQIPTTLLAQVDSSIGGKVAVNHPNGKNLIGAFHQPKMVIIDINTLSTLAEREYRAGLGEIIKYGIIYDKNFFSYMEENYLGIMNRENNCLEEIIFQSCRIKGDIVEQDEKETGIRAIVNLGHTLGHSLEKLTRYEVYRHGEAVAMGIAAASYLASDLGYLKDTDRKRIKSLLKNLGLGFQFPQISNEQIYEGTLNDKKIQNGVLRWVVPQGIGKAAIIKNVSRETVIKSIGYARLYSQ